MENGSERRLRPVELFLVSIQLARHDLQLNFETLTNRWINLLLWRPQKKKKKKKKKSS